MAAEPSSLERLWAAYRRAGRIENTPELAEHVRRALVPIAVRAWREMDRRPHLDDLIGAGAIGLLHALRRYDPSRGLRLETYCGVRILGSMYDDQKNFAWAKGALRLKAQRVREASRELRARFARPPSDQELADTLGLSRAEVVEARRLARHPAPLSIHGRNADGSPDHHVVPRAPGRDPMRSLLAAEARSTLLETLKSLPHKQRATLLLYYFERLTMAQIGDVLELSESRISQIHTEALERLLRRLGPDGPELLDLLGD